MTRKFYVKITAALLFSALLIWMGAAVFLPRLLNLDNYRPQLLSLMEKSLNRQVSYKTASFSRQLIPSIVFNGITVKEKKGDMPLLTVDRLTFRLALLPLLHKELRLRGIVLERPVIMLERDQAGVFSISDLFSGSPSAYNLHINDIRIQNGLIHFRDRMNARDVFTASLEGLNLQLDGLTRGGTSKFKLSTAIIDRAGRAELSLSGSVGIPASDVSFNESRLDVALSAKNIHVDRYWLYYGRFLPFERVLGALDIQGVFKGTLQDFATKGSLSFKGLRVAYPQVFRAPITPKQIELSYDLAVTPRDFTAKSLDLKVDGLQVKGDLALKDMHGKDPHLTARLDSSAFSLEEMRNYIPYGVIPRGTADFIEEHIKGGTFKLLAGRLDGRISQILHMDQGTNYNALLVRATVDKGLMSFGPQVPAISAINGGLEFRGKDFILSGMTGKFGGSPFTLDGKIADYPLPTPASYPCTVSITPAPTEVAWLLHQQKSGQMIFSGQSLLRLSGSGFASDYRISGSWDLSGADYDFARQIHKPTGLTNRIGFNASLGSAEARLTELHYELPPLNITASAIYRYDDRVPLSCTVATNQFDVRTVLPVIPALAVYHSAGKLQAGFSATGNPTAPDSFQWAGAVTLADFSLRLNEQISPLTLVNGTITVSGTVLETERMTGKLGNSDFTVKGSVNGFSNPVAQVSFSSPGLHLRDLGYRSPNQDPQLQQLTANVFLKDGSLTLSALNGQLNRSSFSVKGELLDIMHPKVTLRADFTYLMVEDLQLLAGMQPAGGDHGKPGGIDLKLRATAKAGSVREIPFAKLDTELYVLNNQLVVQALSVGVLGGTISGSGSAARGSSGAPLYQAQYRLDRVDVAQLSKAAGAELGITGQLAAEGELTAQGITPAKLKKSSAITARLHLQDGLLPNLRGTGGKIPYRVFDANLSFDRGVLTVQGLKAGVLGGTVSGSGTADLSSAVPRYQAQYSLEQIDAAQFAKASGAGLAITGQLTANGDLTAQGNSSAGLKKTARGSVNIELHNVIMGVTAAAEKGNVKQVPFKTIQGRLSFEKDLLTIQSAQVDVFGGVVSGTGTADFTAQNNPGYRVKFTSKSIDTAQLDQTFDFKSDITGRLALQGELAARGADQGALKKSLQGSLVMRMEKGTLNKFTIISKIFSILNVSQLFHLRLPDMVRTGMPYDSISGNFSLADGSASTSDLSIDGSSINMKIVGKTDLVKKEIDLTVGVQPLQTVGKIIGHIPVIGWILTGGDRRFLVTYYEAKGSWSDPKVTSANISTLPQGVFNIFKRAFSLPERLITSTGDVIMDN